MAMITATVTSKYEPPTAAPTKATTPIAATSKRPARIDSLLRGQRQPRFVDPVDLHVGDLVEADDVEIEGQTADQGDQHHSQAGEGKHLATARDQKQRDDLDAGSNDSVWTAELGENR